MLILDIQYMAEGPGTHSQVTQVLKPFFEVGGAPFEFPACTPQI